MTEPSAAVRDAPGGGHVGYVDHEGNELRHDELFTDPGPQFTFVIAARRILQKFHFPGQHASSMRTGAQLVYNAGARVPRHDAHRLMAAVRDASGDGEGKPAAVDGGQGS